MLHTYICMHINMNVYDLVTSLSDDELANIRDSRGFSAYG